MKQFIVATIVALAVALPATASAQAPACCEDGNAPATVVNQDPSYTVLPVTLQIYSESSTAQFELETQSNEPIRPLTVEQMQQTNGGALYTVTVDSVPARNAVYHICVASAPGMEYICIRGYEVSFYVADPVIKPVLKTARSGRRIASTVSLQVSSIRSVVFHSTLSLQKRVGGSWRTVQRYSVVRANGPRVRVGYDMPTLRRSFTLPRKGGKYRVTYRVRIVTDLGVTQGEGSATKTLR